MLLELTGMKSKGSEAFKGGQILSEAIQAVIIEGTDCILLTVSPRAAKVPSHAILEMLPLDDFLHLPETTEDNEYYLRKSSILAYIRTAEIESSEDVLVISTKSSVINAPASFEDELKTILEMNDFIS